MRKKYKGFLALLLSASMVFGGSGVSAVAAYGAETVVSEDAVSTESVETEALESTEDATVEEASTEDAEVVSENSVEDESTEESSTEEADTESANEVAVSSVKVESTGSLSDWDYPTSSHTYDGTGVTFSENTKLKSSSESYTYKYYYSTSSNQADRNEVSKTGLVDAGWYVISANAISNNTVVSSVSFDYIIKPASITVSTDSAEATVTSESGKLATPLTAPSANIIKGSLVTGDTVEYTDWASLDTIGVSDNSCTMVGTNDTKASNYDVTYQFGTLTVLSGWEADRNQMNNIRNLKATMNKKGVVTVKWAKPKKAKSVTYTVFRRNADGTWTTLSEGQKKRSYKDTDALSVVSSGEGQLVYRVIATGTDSYGTTGCGAPAYVQCVPKILTFESGPNYEYINLKFVSNAAPAGYYVEQYSTKNKSKKDVITVSSTNLTSETYTGKLIKNKSAVCTAVNYQDAGSDNVTIADSKNVKFIFRIAAAPFTITDLGEEVEVPQSKYTGKKGVKLTTGNCPQVTASADSLTSIHFTYSKVKKAKGYLVEYSTSPDFTSSGNNIYVKKFITNKTSDSTYKKWKIGYYDGYSNYGKIEVSNVVTGVPYYFRCTAYFNFKPTSDYDTVDGDPGVTSEVVSNYGRPVAVTSLKAKYYSGTKSDAGLTWSYTSKYGDNIVGYRVARQNYKENSSSKEFTVKDGSEVELRNLSNQNTSKSYKVADGNKIPNGERIEYTVQAIYKNVNATYKATGSCYLYSDPATVDYMNPTAIEFLKKKGSSKTASSYTVKKGSTLNVANLLSFDPSATTNDSVEYESSNTDYVTVTDEGVVKGVKATGSKTVTLTVTSKNDSSVTNEIRIKVSTSSSSSGSSDDSSSDTSSLVVCLDPGHGGSDSGATYSGSKEKDINLAIAKKVGSYLEDSGVKVYYTRTDDTYVSLTDRTDYAKNKGCNLFVSIHCNSASSTSTKGTEVYYSLTSYGRPNLASKISSAVSNALDTTNRGAKTRQGDNGDYYSVIRTSAAKGIPGLIVEHGYMTNSSDLSKLTNSSYVKSAAKAEANAIINYWKS
ncbi:MAG: N-acetylmuramoyl-L-alanine amidase [Lachnospiraceae bacterium]|nr:N-acetylmuramoyl-L-alanine amidase [Lachnospiraceae bacterium]